MFLTSALSRPSDHRVSLGGLSAPRGKALGEDGGSTWTPSAVPLSDTQRRMRALYSDSFGPPGGGPSTDISDIRLKLTSTRPLAGGFTGLTPGLLPGGRSNFSTPRGGAPPGQYDSFGKFHKAFGGDTHGSVDDSLGGGLPHANATETSDVVLQSASSTALRPFGAAAGMQPASMCNTMQSSAGESGQQFPEWGDFLSSIGVVPLTNAAPTAGPVARAPMAEEMHRRVEKLYAQTVLDLPDDSSGQAAKALDKIRGGAMPSEVVASAIRANHRVPALDAFKSSGPNTVMYQENEDGTFTLTNGRCPSPPTSPAALSGAAATHGANAQEANKPASRQASSRQANTLRPASSRQVGALRPVSQSRTPRDTGRLSTAGRAVLGAPQP